MAENNDPKFIDKRTAPRYLRSGLLDDKTYERVIKGLPDVADKAASVSTVMGGEESIASNSNNQGDNSVS